MYFQFVYQQNSAQAGIKLLPLVASLAAGNISGGLISASRNYSFHTFVAGSAIMVIGCGLFTSLPETFSIDPRMYGFEVILGFGSGLAFYSITLLTSLEAPAEEHCKTPFVLEPFH